MEDALQDAKEVFASKSSGRPIVFGSTKTGRQIAVVFEVVDDEPLAPITAYEIET